MNDRLKTEDEYREALKRFIEILESGNEPEKEEELARLIKLLDKYEYENC
jgi:hypothetical protein